jgi:DNA mismatch repair ATPase MutS
LPDALMDRVHSFHFRESIDHGVMSFDYLLRPGPVSRGNALHVMRLAGLPVPVDPAAG